MSKSYLLVNDILRKLLNIIMNEIPYNLLKDIIITPIGVIKSEIIEDDIKGEYNLAVIFIQLYNEEFVQTEK